MSRYIKLPNSLVFDADKVVLVAREGLNEYVVLIEGAPMALKLDGMSLELLETFLGVKVLEAPSKVMH